MNHTLKLNSLVTGTITEIAFGGSGILKVQGLVLFVPFTAPGDEIEAIITELKKGYGRAKLSKIIKPSPTRVQPKCPYFGTCMGCQLQHIDYETQLEEKKQAVKEALLRIGKIDIPEVSIVPSPKEYTYRERITLHLDEQKLGYISLDNTSILDIKICPIFTEDSILERLNQAKDHEFKKQKGRLQVLKDQKGSFVVHASIHPKPAIFPPHIRFSKDEEITSHLLGLKFTYSPKVFIQNNRSVSEQIYLKIVELMREANPSLILDLYSGIGVTSCLLSKEGYTLYSIELNSHSIRYARRNQEINGLKNITFIEGKAEEKIPHQPFDAVLLNPPRTGCEKIVIEKIRDVIQPKTIIYVSCMPSTLARDLNILGEGYRTNIVQAFDMFPQTGHIETLVRLERA